jgi:hypothetical protein
VLLAAFLMQPHRPASTKRDATGNFVSVGYTPAAQIHETAKCGSVSL